MVWTIDGEQYQVELPDLSVIQALDKGMEGRDIWVVYPSIVLGDRSKEEVLVSGTENGSYVCDRSFPPNALEHAYFGFRPMLVPLDAAGCDISSQMTKENPGFSVSRGGSLYWGPSPGGVNPAGTLVSDERGYFGVTDPVYLGDTCSGHEWHWVWYHGRLVAARDVLPSCDLYWLIQNFTVYEEGVRR